MVVKRVAFKMRPFEKDQISNLTLSQSLYERGLRGAKARRTRLLGTPTLKTLFTILACGEQVLKLVSGDLNVKCFSFRS